MKQAVAVVTGASSGIGKAISKMLLQKGYIVYGFGRNFSSVQELGEQFHPVTLDMTNIALVTETMQNILKEHEVAVLVNNAGVGYFGLHEELNPAKIHEMVAVNVEAPLVLSQLALRSLKRQQGWLIQIASVTAEQRNPHGCAYGATKAAVNSFSESLFEEARKYGVKVASILPDMTESNFYRNADFCQGDTEDTYLHPQEVADCVKWMLEQRDGMVVSKVTLRPQRHRLGKKSKE